MYHQTAEYVLISPGTDHLDLAAASLLCRSSHRHDASTYFAVLNSLSCTNYSSKTRCSNEIMTTSVSNCVESVIPVC